MTKITIIAATQAEIAPIVSCFGDKFDYIVSGIGSLSTAIAVMRAVRDFAPNLVLGVGVAGAIDRSLSLGQAVIVARDYVADLGAFRGQAHEKFEHFESQVVEYPYVVDGFTSVSARTVNAACGLFVDDHSQIETMEGAALMLTAKALGVRFMQLRTISNYVDSPRVEWQIAHAIELLPSAVARLLKCGY
ncbi:MAG: hypothetical protein RR465_06035 [Mucinivorans sp.]